MDRKTNNNSPENIPFSSSASNKLPPVSCTDQVLGHELATLAQAMRETLGFSSDVGDAVLQNSAQRGGNLLAVFHLVEHLSIEDWHNLVHKQGLTGWLALELSRASNHSLAALLKSIEGQLFSEATDPTTGLANETVFMRALSHELQRASRSSTAMSLALVEIDDLSVAENLNLSKVFRSLADHFMCTTRDYDTVARISPERFALILPAASASKSQIMVGRILSNFREELFHFQGVNPLSFSFSAGVATYGGRLRVPATDEAVNMAEIPLRTAQVQGGNRVVLASLNPDTHSDRTTLVHPMEKQFLFSGS